MNGDDISRAKQSSRAKKGVERDGNGMRSGDFAGLVPFGIGIFLTVVVALALFRPPKGDARGTTAVAEAVQGAIGTAPALWIALGCAFLGARWFLLGRSGGFARHLAGIVGLALGLALAAGVFSDAAGGALGSLPRSMLGAVAGRVAGAALGLALLGGSAWAAWLRDSGLVSRSLVSWRKGKTIPGEAALSGLPTDGVSEEEAAALLPPRPLVEPPATDVGDLIGGERPPVSSPYPEDVRKKGEIPPGARPISQAGRPLDDPRRPPSRSGPAPSRSERASTGSQPSSPDDAPSVYRWTPPTPAAALDAPGGDLARPAAPVDRAPAPAAARSVGEVRAEDRALAPGSAGGIRPLGPRPGDPPPGVRPVERGAAPPRPSWESAGLIQEELFEAAASAEEEATARTLNAIDAPVHGGEPQGTPVAMAAAAPELEETEEGEEDALAADRETEDDESEWEEWEEEEEEELEAEFGVGTQLAIAEVEEDEESDELEDELDLDAELQDLLSGAPPALVEEPVRVKEASAELEDELAEPLDEAEDEEAEEEQAELWDSEEELELSEEELSEAGVEGSLEEDEELDGDEEEDGEEAGELGGEGAAARTVELQPAASKRTTSAVAADWSLGADSGAAARPKRSGRGRGVKSGREDAAATAGSGDAGGEQAVTEREVVLEPKPPRAGTAGRGKVLADVIIEAGCLFLERERVAVSMLQRQFGLDFEESCAVLDELQESGLIGPYLGGQQRDILLTREEWLQRVGRA